MSETETVATRCRSTNADKYSNSAKKVKVSDIVHILIEDAVLLQNWSQFSDTLGNPLHEKIQWGRGISNGTLSFYDLFSKILHTWTLGNLNPLTLEDLCHALRNNRMKFNLVAGMFLHF